MFTSEMYPAFGRGCRHEVSRANERPRAARPFVFNPGLRRPFFKVIAQARQPLIQLIERRADSLWFFHRGNSFSLSRSVVRHDDSARPWLIPGWLPNFYGVAGERETVQTFLFP